MSNFHTIGPTSIPTRVISIEPTLQGGSCRSCGQLLKQGEMRIKVAYPNIFVHYYTKSGSPSFFMHPFCFELNPVDFCHGGKGAYKDVLPIKGFSIDPSKDIVGYDKFPDLHAHFRHSLTLYTKEQENVKPSLSMPTVPVLKEDANESKTLGHTCGGVTTQTLESAANTANSSSNEADTCNAHESSRAKAPSQAGMKRKRQLLSSEISTLTQDQESAYLRRSPHSSTTEWERQRLWDEMNTLELKPKQGKVDTCVNCRCHSTKTERCWASPSEAEDILGASAALLRSLANSREIPVFKRPSGHRVYNIPAIREYFANKTVPAKPKFPHCNPNTTPLSTITVDSETAVTTLSNEPAALPDSPSCFNVVV